MADILSAVESWFFENDEFANKIEKFAQEKCEVFSLDSAEHKLEYTELYKQFKAIFESELEAFVKSKGVEPAEFYKVCAEENKKEDGNHFFQWLIATSDYEVFVQMMREEKAKKAA
eukprot:TRINITY_DN21319_c0_g1_i1.p3 TRINITY_DN21319_c0_g1~~TRINITY_DN21319_c0_g1_i1.p3  ORF type:complete len:116 (-),score=32.77 TRINITY_DN21319_c0_g1_i1:107-454(-)